MPLLQLHNVSKTYGRQVALQPTTLSAPAGQTTVLLGPSGCGKSTLLRLMVGLIKPDAGTVRLNGIELTPDNLLAVRRRLGYVVQDGGLFPHLSARGNIILLARHLGWDDAKCASRVAELAELTRFPTDGLDRFPVQLSGGQKQRVSLMRALMLDPEILLLDEPLGALDPIIRSELQEDLKAIFQKLKKTVVLVTHDLGEAGYFGDRIVLMKDGRIIQEGTLAELVQSPADPFVTRFINAQRSPLESLT